MNKELENISFIWQSEDKEHIFEQLGIKTDNFEHNENSLDLDSIIVYKMTSPRTIIDYLYKKIEDKIENKYVKSITDLLVFTVFTIISPTKIDIHLFDNKKTLDDFMENYKFIESLTKTTKLGTKYISMDDLKAFPYFIPIIEQMTTELKLFRKSDGKYLFQNHYLKNLQTKYI